MHRDHLAQGLGQALGKLSVRIGKLDIDMDLPIPWAGNALSQRAGTSPRLAKISNTRGIVPGSAVAITEKQAVWQR